MNDILLIKCCIVYEEIIYFNSIFMSLSCFNLILLYCTPHSSNNFLEAMLFSEFAYLSDKYIICFIPD